MRSKSRWAALGAGLLLATGLTACGDGGADAEADPKQALADAIEALGDYDGVEMLLSIDGDREALALATDGALDQETTELLLDSTILVRAAGEDEDDAQAEFVVSLGGQDSVEMRILPEQRFFLRVDLDAIGEAIGEADLAASLDEVIAGAEQFGLGDAADAVRTGGWIELIGADELTEMMGMPGASEQEPSEEEIEDIRDRLVTLMQRFLDEDVEVEHLGDESAGERVRATTTEADLAELFDELTTIVSDLGGIDADALAGLPETTGSDRAVHIDFWLDGGELGQVGFDLAQLGDDGAPEGTYILVAIEEFTGSVEAPDEATQVDLAEVMGAVFGGFGDLGDLGDPGGFEGAPGDVDGGEFDEGDLEGEDPLGGECIPQEEIDELTGGDPELEAEFDVLLEMGVLEVC